MKKLLFFILALAAVQAKAQTIKGSIDLRDSTINRSIPFEVAAGSKTLKYAVKVELTEGDATLTFNEPNGKKAGGFTLSSRKKFGGSERSKVESSDSSSPPAAGTWKFTITSQKATGRINYEFDIVQP